jgi:hypothetical protein
MAAFQVQGMESIEMFFKDIATVPERVINDMLNAEAEVVVNAHKKKLRMLGLIDTGKLENSIRSFKKTSRGKPYRLIYPYGDHGQYNRKLVVKAYKRSKHGRTYTVGGDVKVVTNNDVGFIQEFGAKRRGISARQWMQTANEECADDAVKAAAAIYDEYIDSLARTK